MLIPWNKLPINFQNEEIRIYYNILTKKKYSLLLKRVFDIILSLLIFIILLPVFIILSCAIKLDSRGPVFYRQVRVTQYGRLFRIFKFRTMVQNADKIGSLVTVDKDDRITRVGKFIRKYRLDEIPQLLNVLVGDMSFVGTRPEVIKYVEKYSPTMLATLLLPAGVTSITSILYKDEASMLSIADDPDYVYINSVLPEKMKYNLSYLKHFTLIGDFKIMCMTIFAVLGIKFNNHEYSNSD